MPIDHGLRRRDTPAVVPGEDANPGVEDARRVYLAREGAIRLIGSLNYLCGFIGILASFGFILLRENHLRLSPNPQGLVFSLLVEAGRMLEILGMDRILGAPHRQPMTFVFTNGAFVEAYLTAMALAHLILSVVGVAVGYGLRRLQGWARWAQMALAVALSLLIGSSCVLASAGGGLIGAVIAFIPSAWLAYLLMSRKGKMVFSPDYRGMRAVTPHLRPRSALWMAMGLIPLALGILTWVDWSTVQIAITIKRVIG